jgi:hypothetical protein
MIDQNIFFMYTYCRICITYTYTYLYILHHCIKNKWGCRKLRHNSIFGCCEPSCDIADEIKPCIAEFHLGFSFLSPSRFLLTQEKWSDGWLRHQSWLCKIIMMSMNLYQVYICIHGCRETGCGMIGWRNGWESPYLTQ